MSFGVDVDVGQGCVMSPWLFNIYMDGCMMEVKARAGNVSVGLKVRGAEESMVAGLPGRN